MTRSNLHLVGTFWHKQTWRRHKGSYDNEDDEDGGVWTIAITHKIQVEHRDSGDWGERENNENNVTIAERPGWSFNFQLHLYHYYG